MGNDLPSETLEVGSVSVQGFSSKCEAVSSVPRIPNVNSVELSDVGMKEESVVCDSIVENKEFTKLSASPNVDAINMANLERSESVGVQTGTNKEHVEEGISLIVESESNSKNVSEKECSFEVGDLVWVKARTWWPGMIHDPSDGPSGMKPKKRFPFLVKYYGNDNFIWCNSSSLKPFIEHYNHLSNQNTSRSLYEAVEEALCEVDCRMKLKMTCRCFLKDKNEYLEENLGGKGKSEEGVLSLSHFEPLVVLTRFKELACGIYSESKIELIVLKNRMLSFYRSAGHHELPLRVLLEAKSESCVRSARAKKKRNPSDYDDLASGNKTASESRERKKSKFLSYPDADKSNNREEMGKNLKKKGLTKSLKDHHVINKADDIDAPSSDLLTKLRSMACDYFSASEYLDSLRIFYGSFRSYAYLDADVADVEIKRKIERVKKAKKSEDPSSNLDSVEGSAGDNDMCKKISKKGKSVAKESDVVEKKDQDQSPFTMSTHFYPDNSCNISFSNPRDETIPEPPHEEPMSRLPDLNKNTEPIPAIEIPVGGPSKNEGLVCPNINGADQSAFAYVLPSEGPTQSIHQFFNVGITNDVKREYMAWGEGPEIVNTGLASFSQPSVTPFRYMDFFRDIAEPNEKKSYEKSFQFTDSFIIPDLNGNAPEMMSPSEKVTSPFETVMSPSEKSAFSDGLEGKKRSLKREDPGGSLTLNFAPGSVLPSKEMMVAQFSRYGLVKESEIQALNECTVHIPYERTPDVKFAYRSLERGHTFGESLVSFHLHCQEEKITEKKMRKQQHPVVVVPVDAFKNQIRPIERPPDIAFMKQSVEKMKLTLKETGDKFSPETRLMLENEIQAFLEKIGPMTGGSSSSS